jgi:hypothetical protein
MNPEQIMRRAGYGLIYDRRTGRESYVRHLGRMLYPRFHMYVEEYGDNYSFNLHLDQKQPSYSGARAHSGEYDGELVEEEMERVKTFLK